MPPSRQIHRKRSGGCETMRLAEQVRERRWVGLRRRREAAERKGLEVDEVSIAL